MPIGPGTHLGPYKITALIGEGGMGKVWRAHHTALKRDDALKVLPDAFASDTDRLARFRREAQVLASLNHPNIAHVYGLEQSDGVQALVMELVDGPTLADRIAQGPIPFDEALPIAKQIAEALEAAHEQGVVHRDLKPANIKVRPDGTVKVLDFGLAKAIEPLSVGNVNATASPTITSPAMMTGLGMLLGTAAYMSPEQVRGKPVDRRADIWAFGCVLYEMLTGRGTFRAGEITDTVALIVTTEPDWTALPRQTPPPVLRLLRRCLVKNRDQRLPDIGVARLEIDEAQSAQNIPASAVNSVIPRRRLTRLTTSLGAVVVIAVAAVAGWSIRRPPEAAVRRFTITLPSGDQFSATGRHIIALAPDGGSLVYVANQRLYLRRLDRLEAEPIRGTEGDTDNHARAPFFSPNSDWIGFWQSGQLKKVAVSGGAPVTLSKVETFTGATWGPNDTIVYAQGPNGIWQVAGSGGEPSVLIKLDPSKGEVAQEPQILDGKTVLFTLRSGAGTTWNDAQIVVQRLDTGERRVVVNGGSDGRYLPTGHVAYARDGVMLALPFDAEARVATGGATPIVENIRDTSATGAVGPAVGAGAAQFTTSLTALLAYVPGDVAATRRLVWVNRQGSEEFVAGAPTRAYVYPAISPDGARVALDIRDQGRDIWVWDFERTTLSRVTADAGADITPRWTPDGRRIVFSSDRSGQLNLFWQMADGTGTAEQLSMSSNIEWPLAVSSDGAQLLCSAQEPRGEYDLAVLRVHGSSRMQSLTDTDSFDDRNGTLSPDGAWIAYESNESGRLEVYVSPFPDVKSSRQLISTDGGTRPIWARAGRELFYVSASGSMMAVPVRTTPTLVTGKPVQLFEMSYFRGLTGRTYDVSPDGQRFLMIKDADVKTSTAVQIVIVENWLNELKRLVPTN